MVPPTLSVVKHRLKGVGGTMGDLETYKVVQKNICIKRTTYPSLKETLLFWRMDGPPNPFQTHVSF